MILVKLNKLRRWQSQSELDIRKMRLMRMMAEHDAKYSKINGLHVSNILNAILKGTIIVEHIINAETPHDLYELGEMIEAYYEEFPVE